MKEDTVKVFLGCAAALLGPSLTVIGCGGDSGPLDDEATDERSSGVVTETYLSDLTWSYATSGWGPVEKDKSNGQKALGDGKTITLNGATYAKGLGVHADSDVRYPLGGKCSYFRADVGVDDESGTNGSVAFQVWADGVKLYDSGVVTGATATKKVDVDVSGRAELRLLVTNAGNGIDYDHADWAIARIGCDASAPGGVESYLSDRTSTSATNGWGPVEKDKSNGEASGGDGKTITLNGKSYAKGLGVHASSDVRYALGGKCSTFRADVGVDDEVNQNGSVVFQVYADNVKLYDSGTMTGASATKTVEVGVAGKSELRLVVTDAGNGKDYDHADWAAARVSCPPASGCGDGVCGSGETCSSCAADCGSCPSGCGDGTCGGGETCSSCPSDCGSCMLTPSAPIVVTSNDVTIDGVSISSAGMTGAGISATGTAANPIRNLTIKNSTIKGFRLGVYLRQVENLTIQNCTITDADYAGIAVYSGVGGKISGNTVQRIGVTRTDFTVPAFLNNAYGITLDRTHTGNLTTDPLSTGFLIEDNLVEDVPLWMCLNVHAATNTTFKNNTARRCPRAIFIAGDGDTPNNHPSQITVTGNHIEQAVTKPGGTTDLEGILIASLQGGSITNNVISASFQPPASGVFDYQGQSTNVTISGNTVIP